MSLPFGHMSDFRLPAINNAPHMADSYILYCLQQGEQNWNWLLGIPFFTSKRRDRMKSKKIGMKSKGNINISGLQIGAKEG